MAIISTCDLGRPPINRKPWIGDNTWLGLKKEESLTKTQSSKDPPTETDRFSHIHHPSK